MNETKIMMKKLITTIIAAAVVMGTVGITTQAAEKKKPAKKEGARKSDAKKAKRDTYPYRGVIGSVDGNKIVIKQKSGERTIVVGEDAKVTIDGKKGKLGDIKAGDYVTGQVKKTAGKETAVSVYKKDKPEPKKKAPKKKKTDDK